MVSSKIITKKLKTSGKIGETNELVKYNKKGTTLIVLVDAKKSFEKEVETEGRYGLFSGTVVFSDSKDWKVGDFFSEWSIGLFDRIKGKVTFSFKNKKHKNKKLPKLDRTKGHMIVYPKLERSTFSQLPLRKITVSDHLKKRLESRGIAIKEKPNNVIAEVNVGNFNDSHIAHFYALNAINFIKERSTSRRETLEKEGWKFVIENNKNPMFKKEGWPDLPIGKMQAMTDDAFYVFLCPPYLKSDAKEHLVFGRILEEFGELKEPEFTIHCAMNEEVWNALLEKQDYQLTKVIRPEFFGNMKRNCDYKFIQIIPSEKQFYPADDLVNGSIEMHVDDYLKNHLKKRNPKQG